MYFTKATKSISKIVLMFFALIVFSGALTQSAAVAAAPTPTPIQVQTFGTLPVMVFNLTQSAIAINLVPSLTNVYTAAGFPMGVGFSGVYYVDQGTGMAHVPNPTNPRFSSLSPFVTNGNQYNANNDFMQVFNLFPSWSATSANSAAMRDCTMLGGGQPSANTAGVIVKYADYNNYTLHKGSNAGTLYVHDSANPSSTAIKLSLADPSATGSFFASYDININNLGKGTSAFQAEPANASPDYLQTMLEIAIDAESIITGDPLGIIAIFAGIPATVQNISEAVNNNASNSVYVFDSANPVSSKGVTVLAANDPKFSGGGTVTYNQGDSDSSLYNVLSDPNDPQSYANLPPLQQNAVYVRTFRQAPSSNSGPTQLSSADLLMVFVVNEAVYSANQAQQLINNPSALKAAAKAPYKPTKAQAEDSLKILKIITDIHKVNPQDAKQLIAMFGTHGTYKSSKKDAAALGKIKIQLIEIFEKHKKDLPAINEYLTKLHQK